MRRLILALFALAFAAPAAAQTPPTAATQPAKAAPAFEARAKELVGILAGTVDYEKFFAPSFRTAVPKAKFDPINAQLNTAYGAPVAVDTILPTTPYAGIVQIRFAKAVIVFQMVVDPAEPHQVTGLLVKGAAAEEKSLGEVTAALQKLAGATGYAFARLGSGPPQITLQHNADKRYAVGSAFKLVILAELVRQTNAGERKWDDLVKLDGRQLPGGAYTLKPAGTQVSLRELATRMISVSDNSATDILLATLGRERVEAMLPVLGVQPDPRNRPYLSTLEAFKLKWLEGGALADKFNALDEAGQRAMLEGELRNASIEPLVRMGTPPTTPARIDTIEWFFSPVEMIRIMDWLRRNTEGPKGVEARAVLSKNPGLPIDHAQYRWIGFKGGSEPGVINLTFLLEGADGGWYAASASWNNTAASVDNQRFVGLMTALLAFAGPPKP